MGASNAQVRGGSCGFVSDVDAGDLIGFFFQAEDGIRDLVRSRGLGDVYKRQGVIAIVDRMHDEARRLEKAHHLPRRILPHMAHVPCLLYTSDAADERSSVDLVGRRIIKKTSV